MVGCGNSFVWGIGGYFKPRINSVKCCDFIPLDQNVSDIYSSSCRTLSLVKSRTKLPGPLAA